MKRKGFTMVELLAAIAILGLLIIMAFPTMRAMQSRNDKRKYEEYGHSMISAAKLYTDSYADDLFPKGYKNEFAVISFNDLSNKDLLKKIGFSDISCNESTVVVAKYGDDYQYCLSMKCRNKSNQLLYEESNEEGICKTYKTKTVIYKYGIKTYEDTIIEGDDAYYAQNPNKFGNFDFASNHQVFQGWLKEGTTQKFNVGEKINSSLLKNNLTLVADTRQFQYTVEYNGNGANNDSIKTQTCIYGQNCYLLKNEYKKTGSTYLDWQDGQGNSYQPQAGYKNLVSIDGGIIKLSAHWRLNKIYILYNANGASLVKPHLDGFTIKDNIIYKSGDSKFFKFNYGDPLGVNGLVDYNNTGYINIAKTGYKMQSKEEWNTKADGTGTSYDMSYQKYNANDFCNASDGDCTMTLYANWKTLSITCPAGKYLAKNATTCSTCTAGNYCPGGTFNFSTSQNQGINACPSGYGNSAAGSSANTNCYMKVAANYYVATKHASSATACPAGHINSAQNVYYGNTSSCTFDTTFHHVEKPKVYFMKYKTKSCSGSDPKRTYYYHSYECQCELNSGGKYLGRLHSTPVEVGFHSHGTMSIHYLNNTAGKKSCKNDTNYYINQNVRTVCNDTFTYNGGNTTVFHGYQWYNYNAGTGVYHSFQSAWHHSGGYYDNRYITGLNNVANTAAQINGACNHVCALLYS